MDDDRRCNVEPSHHEWWYRHYTTPGHIFIPPSKQQIKKTVGSYDTAAKVITVLTEIIAASQGFPHENHSRGYTKPRSVKYDNVDIFRNSLRSSSSIP